MANWKWLLIGGSVFLSYIISRAVSVALRVLKKLADKTETEWDDLLINAIRQPVIFGTITLFWFSIVHLLDFPEKLHNVLVVLIKILLYLGLIWGIYRVADVAGKIGYSFSKKSDSQAIDDHLIPIFNKAIKTVIIVLGALFIIQNLGYNVMSIMAGLGLGGLAFALAAKDTCANLFGSINILVDKPFRVGDHILLEGYEGDVEEIGLRSTRIRTFYDSQISIPNSLLSNVKIDNMGRRNYRRVRATIGVKYDTDPEKITQFVEEIKQIIIANPQTRKDKWQVAFCEFGESSLNILVNFFLDAKTFDSEIVEKEKLFLEILQLAKKLGIHFAFPSQSIYFENSPKSE